MQFGYKKDTLQRCVLWLIKKLFLIMLTIIPSVYCCLLDASKAFDRVHLGKLFSILLHKDIPTTVVRLYFDSYSRQKARVG